MNELVIDASGAVLGRLASYAAKQALLGKSLVIVNCDNVLITGGRRMTINEFSEAVKRGGFSLRGPNLPRKNTEKMVKRTIRGMLSYKQGRGLEAFKRIMCYPNVPKEFENSKKTTLVRQIKNTAISLKELSKEI